MNKKSNLKTFEDSENPLNTTKIAEISGNEKKNLTK